MWRLTLRSVRSHGARLALSVLAVVLGIAFLSGTFQLRVKMQAVFDDILDVSITADAYVRGATQIGETTEYGMATMPAYGSFSETVLDVVRAVDGVERAEVEFNGAAILIGADGTPVAQQGAPGFAMGTGLGRAEAILTGRYPVGPGEVLLERTTAEKAGLGLGDETKVVVAGQIVPVTVVGIEDEGAGMAGASIVIFDQAVARELLAPDGMVEMIAVQAAGSGSGSGGAPDTAELVDAINAALTPESGAAAVTYDIIRAENKAVIDTILGFIETLLLVFVGIALFIGGFVIANTFTMTVRERSGEYALLRALGASRGQVFGVVLGQAALVGLVGSGIGIAAGIGLMSLIRFGLVMAGMPMDSSVNMTGADVAIALAVGVLATVVASAIPARRAASIPPVEAMREQSTGGARSLRPRGLIGAILLGGGIGGVVVAAAGQDGSRAGLLAVGAVAVLLGALIAAPAAIRTGLGALAWPLAALVRPMGRLARANAMRNPRRSASTAGALMVGIALVSAAAVLAASMKASVDEEVEQRLLCDLVVQTVAGSPLPSGLPSELGSLAEVGQSGVVFGIDATVDGQSTWVNGAEPWVLTSALKLELTGLDGGELPAQALVVSAASLRERGWQLGQTVTITTPTSSLSLPIAATIPDNLTMGDTVVTDDAFRLLVPQSDQAVWTVFLKAAAGVDTATLRTAVAQAASPYLIVAVLDADDLRSQMAQQVSTILGIMYALLAMALVIAVLGIVNTLALSVIERTREIGLLRAIGLGRGQLAGMITLESIIIAVGGALAGLGIGVGLAAALRAVTSDQGLTVTVIPWAQIAWMLGAAGLAGALAALWPAIRAARLPILTAVAE